jgi:alpha-tubulin suppressor-like RCC1 family protein
VYDIFVGGDGAGHSAAITGKNTAYVWGKNSTDSLGIESGESVVLPTLVPDLQVTKISFGDTHSLFITRTKFTLINNL